MSLQWLFAYIELTDISITKTIGPGKLLSFFLGRLPYFKTCSYGRNNKTNTFHHTNP